MGPSSPAGWSTSAVLVSSALVPGADVPGNLGCPEKAGLTFHQASLWKQLLGPRSDLRGWSCTQLLACLYLVFYVFFPILFHISLLPLWVPKAFLLFPLAMSHFVIFYSLPATYKQLKTNNKSAQSAFHDRNWCDHVDPLHLSLGSKPSIEVDYLWCPVTALKSINKRIISTPH